MVATTNAAQRSANIATEQLSRVALKAHLPRAVMLTQAHFDTSLDGANTNTKNYRRRADLGAAAAATEGSEIAVTHQLTLGTTVQSTPTEGVGARADITEDAIMQELGITFAELQAFLDNGSVDQFRQLLAPYINDMLPMGIQKIESDGLALISGISTSVGTSGSDLTILNGLEAIYNLRKNQTTRPFRESRFILAPNQVHEWNVEALVTTGGIGGAIWNNQADFGLARVPGDALEGNGFVGTFLGYPVHEMDDELAPVSAGNVHGFFGIAGVPGVAPDDPALAGGAGCFVYNQRTPLAFATEVNRSLRAIELILNARYDWKEVEDLNGVLIATDQAV